MNRLVIGLLLVLGLWLGSVPLARAQRGYYRRAPMHRGYYRPRYYGPPAYGPRYYAPRYYHSPLSAPIMAAATTGPGPTTAGRRS